MNSCDEAGLNELSNSARRVFCTNLLLTSAGLLLVAPAMRKGVVAQDRMVAYPARKIEGAETLLPGRVLYFNYPTRNDPAVLLRSSEGEYSAYSRRCSHAGCSVDFDPSSRCLRCPCHQGTFDGRMGYVMFGPPRRPLDAIILEVRAGGHIWAIGKGIGRDSEIITEASKGGDRK